MGVFHIKKYHLADEKPSAASAPVSALDGPQPGHQMGFQCVNQAHGGATGSFHRNHLPGVFRGLGWVHFLDGVEHRLKLDLRNFVYRGAVQLVSARLYQGQTTNFRTRGGGFAAVFAVGRRTDRE